MNYVREAERSPQAWYERLSLQIYLVALVLLVLVPTLGVVALTLLRAGQSYRDASINQLLETANVVARSVQSELQTTAHLLATYAPALRDTPFRGFQTGVLFDGYIDSTRIRATSSGTVAQVSHAHGVPADLAVRAASTGETTVSNILLSDVDGKPAPRIAICVPRGAAGTDVEVTTLIAKPTVLIQTLVRQGAFGRASLLLAVTDGTGHIIARSRDAAAFIGKPVPDWQSLLAVKQENGTFEARMLDGPRVIFAFQTVRGTPGWAAVVGEPLEVFNNRWRQPMTTLFVTSAVAVCIALALAMLLARRILLPIRHLAQRARAVAEGRGFDQKDSVTSTPSLVAEFETLRQSLAGAEVETRRSHEALHRSYEALREAEKLARIGSWMLDLASGRLTYSDMLYEINGFDPNGPPLTLAVLQDVLTEESHQRVKAAIAKCAATGEPYGMEVEHLRTDGTRFTVYVRGKAQRDETGRIVSLAGTVQDISERHEERERLAALADNLPSGAIYRLETRASDRLAFTYISAGIARLIGISAAEIVEDHAVFLDAIHPEDRAGYLATKEQSRRDISPIDHGFRMITRDGRVIWMHCRSAPRRQSDGRVVWDGIARDITGERSVAEALRQAKEAAEAAERTKSDFLATMSHEIRTPMNSVIGMTRLTLQTDLAPKQRNYLEKIDVSAKALLGIINDVLDFSKIEAGGLEFEDTVFTLESVLESVSAVMAMPAEEKGLEIAYAVSACSPRRLRGDPLRLGQVLINLVSNAVKFTETGEVIISIAPTCVGESAPLLRFAVRDTGIGLSTAQISGLFRPFSQAGNDTSRKYGGTGLGLAICKKLVEKMGGRIWVESEPGKGSTFFFTICCGAVADETEPADAASRPSHLQGRRVLIVDDSASARKILSDMVGEFGLSVETAASGMQALTQLRAAAQDGKPFDIVLMDWRMPTMDGLETARRIRADEQLLHTPQVLMVTAYGREEVLRGAQQLGLQGALIKPIPESVMFNTLLDILPRLEQHTLKFTAPRRAPPSGGGVYARLAGKRILVVDDNALNREVAGDFLLAVGAEVDTAIDGVDALEKLQRREFDAVLMDMHMPRMGGLSAVREIRRQERWSKLPVIALTAQARIADKNASSLAGMSAHLTKPIDDAALYRTLIEALGLATDPGDSEKLVHGPVAVQTVEVEQGDFSLSEALRRLGGAKGRVDRLLKGFLRDFADTPQRLTEYLGTHDTGKIAALAHSVKGSAGYFSTRDFYEFADRLERAARDGGAAGLEDLVMEFYYRMERFLRDVDGGVDALRELDARVGAPVDRDAVLAMIDRAAALVGRGEYAASQLLEQIRDALQGRTEQELAIAAQAHFDELELEAAGAALSQLSETLGAACRTTRL